MIGWLLFWTATGPAGAAPTSGVALIRDASTRRARITEQSAARGTILDSSTRRAGIVAQPLSPDRS